MGRLAVFSRVKALKRIFGNAIGLALFWWPHPVSAGFKGLPWTSTCLCPGLTLCILAATAMPACGQKRYPIEDTIVLGMSTALGGPAARLGRNMAHGVETAIEEVNAAGGIKGRKLRLVVLDDGYEPSRTAPNMHSLVDKERVLAVIGNVGTPTAVAAIPIANASHTPFVGAFTGAGILRENPPDRYVINYRASYLEEITAMVNALVEFGGLGPHDIAFFTQRDAYGDVGFASGIWALKLNGLKDESAVVHGRYERNTLAVENGLADIILSERQPRAVIMVGAYAPCAAFISLARKSGLKAVFLNVSFVGAEPLADELGPDGDGVIITQVVPHFDSDLPIVRDYSGALAARGLPDRPTFGSLEGYIAMRMLRLGLESIKGSITRESVVDALEGLGEFDLGLGQPLRLTPVEHQACHTVWPTILKAGKPVPFEWNRLGDMFKGK